MVKLIVPANNSEGNAIAAFFILVGAIIMHAGEASFVIPAISSTHALLLQQMPVTLHAIICPSAGTRTQCLRLHAPMARRPPTRSELNTKKEQQEEENEEPPNLLQDPFYIDEPLLLAFDLLALILTTQLLILTEILLQPSFWDGGGFNQPVTLSSFSSLGYFVRRDCLLSICWVVSAVYNRGYNYAAFVNDLESIKSSLRIFVDFSSLLIITKLILAGLGRMPVDGLEILREAWFVIFVLALFRFVYSRANRF
jgi:hypothetical protein